MQHTNDNTINKVYVNPNFNRNANTYRSNPVMHVNPKFSHILSNVQQNVHNSSKIYVNPNFMNNKVTFDNNEYKSNAIPYQNYVQNTVIHNPNLLNSHEQMNTPVPTTQSRYTIVRQNASKVLESKVAVKSNTFHVNKYKSISLKDVKRNLENVKATTSITSTPPLVKTDNMFLINKKQCTPVRSTTGTKNRFKLINTVVRNDKSKIKTLNDTSIKLHLNQLKSKRARGNLKKINIPCPMFRKYGKCLRKSHGKCEFLHDKKHVSICRKFIKGLCHDKECPLSHDLTTKKMPTCYFYLQGTCTKSECPYLHVKINDKVKVCPDFIAGYCEKGSKCLMRHVHIQRNKKRKSQGTLITKSNMVLKRRPGRIKNKSVHNSKIDADKMYEKSVDASKIENKSDCRYYQEKKDVDTNESCQMIKPVRCKLGTLPSFIQL